MVFQSAYPDRGRGRGGFALRNGRGGPRARFPVHREDKPNIISRPFGELLATFSISELGHAAQNVCNHVAISDCNYAASYNWLDAKDPTISVPGKPPRWTPLKQPQRLKEDSGHYFRDPNAARFPGYPTEPAVHSVLLTTSILTTSEVDIFACGSTLGNLLRFVRQADKPFRFDLELIGNTVFMVRKENDPREIIEGVRGYGHSFPEAYTAWDDDVKGSETHQRIIQYDLGGFNCMVRFECDGYLPAAMLERASTASESSGTASINDLLLAMDNSKVDTNLSRSDCALTINSSGSKIPQETVFDLKTRSGRHKVEINMQDMYPLLWLKQIPNFVIAYHDGAGLFQDIRVQDVRNDVNAWEKENKSVVQRLISLLGQIVKVAKENPHELMEVYCPSADRLEIRKQYGEGSHALPPALTAEWVGMKEASLDTFEDIAGTSDSDERHELQERRYSHHDEVGDNVDDNVDDDDDDDVYDFTACDASYCGYCGKCTY